MLRPEGFEPSQQNPVNTEKGPQIGSLYISGRSFERPTSECVASPAFIT